MQTDTVKAKLGVKTPEVPKHAKQFREFIAASVQHRETFLSDWKENVNNRVMKPFVEGTLRDDTVAVPEDWARTKQKSAQLAYQVPRIIATPKNPKAAPAAPIFQAVLNHKLHKEIKADVMLDECSADVINAAGIMVSLVSVEVTTETVDLPETDISHLPPEQQALMLQSQQVKTVHVERPIYKCYKWRRISPAAFLWPAEFTGSDWDEAPWLGYESWMLISEAKKRFNLPADFKAKETKPVLLAEDVMEGSAKPSANDNYVKLQTIIYKAYQYHDESKHPEHLRRLVFVDGREQPVLDEDLPWQEYVEPQFLEAEVDEQGQEIAPPREVPGHYIGVRKNPIRVETLTYVSDMAIPPSDSKVGRTQVRELIRSRSQMIRQRERSIPVRWFDTNRLDETIVERLKNGEWQDTIPVNGPGERAIGEVSRAQWPRENFSFQNVIGSDLDRAWSLSSTQLATSADTSESATKTKLIQSAAEVRLEYEKTRMARYFIGGVEVLAGLLQMFTDTSDYVEIVGPDGVKRLAAWDRGTVNIDVAFDIVPDSAERIDPSTRIERILKLYNLAANDPNINRQALLRQLVEAYGMDPTVVTKEPPPPKDEPPNVSYRFSGEDMLNPMAVALMLKANPDLGAAQIKAAATMIQDSMKALGTVQALPQVGPGGTPPDGTGGAPPAAPPPAPPPVEPPETNAPILKRLDDGSRMM